MGKLNIPSQYHKWLKKYKYVIAVLLIGAVFILWPTETDQHEPVILSTESNILTTEEKLRQVLSSISGAGKVQVMLSVKTGEEVVYQTDDRYTSEGAVDSSDTVTVTDENRVQSGLVCKVIPPTYQGAVVVCEGADRPQVRLAVIDAVSKVTGLGADKIAVLKMN